MASIDDPYTHKYPCPTGAFVVITVANEAKMSHWIETTVIESSAGDKLLDFGRSWSTDNSSWIDDAKVRLQMRRYPGDRSMIALVDCAAQTITIESETPPVRSGQTLSFHEFLRSGAI
ncbi:MAG: hypothetical protein QM831_34390 [Kofleriaceae bacterium]